ncbi:MAG: hypothetical protein VYE68_14420 [Acidobacteriota bacterium]|nr:hypothetical protein [Acidobacteriota bacterium]
MAPHIALATVAGGMVQGTLSDIDPKLRVFHGIPFAAPLVGDLR